MQNQILTVEQMYEADRRTMVDHVPGIELMEAAGSGCADLIMTMWSPGRAVILCGPGNNGGDGFVVARLLKAAGWEVRVALLGSIQNLTGDAAEMAGKWQGDIDAMTPQSCADADLVVDAVFGAGLSRPVDGDVRKTLEAAAQSGAKIVAIDVPSGIDGNSGAVQGYALPADFTVTFCRKKPGHVLQPGKQLCGEVHVIDIGIPDTVIADIAPSIRENNPALWFGSFPRPSAADHKYSRGHCLVVGGPPEMTGAGRLAAIAALRIGAGLSTIACPPDSLAINASQLLSVMVRSFVGLTGLTKVLADKRKNAIVIGPGSGVGPATVEMVRHILSLGRPTVIDADALTSFEGSSGRLFESLHAGAVLTPHGGEFERLWPGLLTRAPNKSEAVSEAAAQCGACVVLKGSDTVIAAPGRGQVVNTNAPPYLATAGSGDVLSGFIGGLLAQGMPAFEAACAAVWLHGECAEWIGRGMIAEDLPYAIVNVLAALPS